MIMAKTVFLFTLSWILLSITMEPTAEAIRQLKSVHLNGPELPFFVARENKYYTKFGLIDDFQYAKAEQILDELRSSKELVGVLPVTLAMNEIEQNQNLVIFGAVFQGWDYSIWAMPAISKLGELNGKRVAAPMMPSLRGLVFYRVLCKGDVVSLKLQPVPSSEVYKAMKTKTISAIVVRAPWEESKAKKFGLHKIYDLSILEERIPHTVMVGSRNYLTTKTDEVRSLIDLLRESIRYAKENQKETKEVIRKHYSIVDDQTVNLFYKSYVEKGLEADVRPTKEMWEALRCPVIQSNLFKWPAMERLIDDELFDKLFKRPGTK